MQKQRYNLIELAADLGTSVEELIGYGADGELTICVIADEWPGKLADNSEAEPDVIADGLVELLPIDLLKSTNSDGTEVRQVKTTEGEVIALDSIQTVPRGIHFVTAAERDRLLEVLKPTVAVSANALVPYLDRTHPRYSEDLDAAVKAWLAMYVEGGFKPKSQGHIAQIEAWLRKNYPKLTDYARKRLARVINPNKEGGNPTTRKS